MGVKFRGSAHMSDNKKQTTIPKLRFPIFRLQEAWECFSLGQISDRITKKVGEAFLETFSITAGQGFVSQKEKFGRDISGKQYKNYIELNEGELSYNKGNSKTFQQGAIYKLTEFKKVAVPNAFISFRFHKGYVANFYQGYFDNNFHGKQLLRFLTSGARSDGLLNISPDDFFSIKLPTPSEKEQQKIADCLSSINELITAESKKLNALKIYKKGLMQQLFPTEGATLPKLRFPEFNDAPEWLENTIGRITPHVTAGATPSTTEPNYWAGQIRWMNSGELNLKRVYEVQGRITQLGLDNSSTKILPKKCVLVGLAGQGKTRGTVAMNFVELCTNQSIAAIHPNESVISSDFLYHNLDSRYYELRRISAGDGGRGGLNIQIIKDLKIHFPKDKKEQQKIADFLYSIDELITAESKKIEVFKNHKKGLMQQLFPTISDL